MHIILSSTAETLIVRYRADWLHCSSVFSERPRCSLEGRSSRREHLAPQTCLSHLVSSPLLTRHPAGRSPQESGLSHCLQLAADIPTPPCRTPHWLQVASPLFCVQTALPFLNSDHIRLWVDGSPLMSGSYLFPALLSILVSQSLLDFQACLCSFHGFPCSSFLLTPSGAYPN